MRAISQARGALNALAALLPDTAERVSGAEIQTVPLSELRMGDGRRGFFDKNSLLGLILLGVAVILHGGFQTLLRSSPHAVFSGYVGEIRFVVDLADVAMIDSSGIGLLVRCLTAAKQRAGSLKLLKPSEFAVQTLKMTQTAQTV
jgi:hypothetical protein